MAKLIKRAISNIRKKSLDDSNTAYKYANFEDNKDEHNISNVSNDKFNTPPTLNNSENVKCSKLDDSDNKFNIPPTPNNSGDGVKIKNKKQNKDQPKRKEHYKFDKEDEEIVVSVKINNKNQQNVKKSSKYNKEDEGTLELLSYLVTKRSEEKHQQVVESSPSFDADLLTKKLKEIQKLDRKKDENYRENVEFSPLFNPDIEKQALDEHSQNLGSSKSSSYLDFQGD